MTRADPLEARLLRSINQRSLLRRGDRVLVALSGGPDSVALLHLLCLLRNELGVTLRAAHLDHRLRGRESAGDAAFCQKLARSLAVRLTVSKSDVGKYAISRRLSVETAARDVRKKFLISAAKKAGCNLIATAHTRDDQAETVLLHLLRGAGLTGLAGIPRRNGNFVRPLLDFNKQELLEYLQGHEVTYREDSSNRSDDHARNRVRHRLIPELRRYNPQIVRSLAQLADTVSADLQLIEDNARDAFDRCGKASKSQIAIDLSLFKLYNNGLQRNIVRHAIQRLLGQGQVPGFEAMDKALALMKTARTGARLELLPGVWLEISYGTAVIVKGRAASPRAWSNQIVVLTIPGVVERAAYQINARLLRRGDLDPRGLKSMDAVFFDRDALGTGRLTIAPRVTGETMVPFGRARPKKIKELMIESKLPQAARAGWPVIRAGGRILWIPRVRRSVAAPVTAKTKTILCLEFIPHET